MNSTPNGMLQMTDARIEMETIETEPKSKRKSNKRKWAFGLDAGLCDCFCIKQLENDYRCDEWLGGLWPYLHGRCSFAVLTKKETVVYINCNGL